MTLSAMATMHAQPLFQTDFVFESPGVAITPNGEFMVYTEYRSKTGILIRRTGNREVYARIATEYGTGSIGKVCYGFFTDSTILVKDFTSLVLYNINSGAAVDSVPDAEFVGWMSPTSYLISRRIGELRDYIEYTPYAQTERPLYLSVSPKSLYTTAVSQFLLQMTESEGTQVFRKSDLSLVRTLDIVTQNYRSPFAFSSDGGYVFTRINNTTVGKIDLASGTISNEFALPVPVDDQNRFYLSPDELKLVVVDPQELSVIDLASNARQKVYPVTPNAFLYAAWLPDSRTLLISSSFTVREHTIDVIERGVLRAVHSWQFQTYDVCPDGGTVVSSSAGGPAFAIDPTKSDITHLLRPPPADWIPVGFSARLRGSDTLVGGWENGLLFYSLCTTPWTESVFAHGFEIDENISISRDRRMIVGLTRDRAMIRVLDLSRAKDELLDYSAVGDLQFVRLTENDRKIAVFGTLGAIMYDVQSLLPTALPEVVTGAYSGQYQEEVIDASGSRAVLLSSGHASARVYTSFPTSFYNFSIENSIKLNRFEDANISRDGTLASFVQNDGLIRIIRVADGAEVARRQLPGFFLHFIDPSYIKYDVDKRLLTWQNWFGEFTIERWPEQPVSVPDSNSYVNVVTVHMDAYNLHPNPTSGPLTFNLYVDSGDDGSITQAFLLDVLGKEMANLTSQLQTSGERTHQHTLSIPTNVANGLYYLVIRKVNVTHTLVIAVQR